MTWLTSDLRTGLEPPVAQNRERLIQKAGMVGAVWMGLSALLAATLLGVHVDPFSRNR